jgi:hypothetical protein
MQTNKNKNNAELCRAIYHLPFIWMELKWTAVKKEGKRER